MSNVTSVLIWDREPFGPGPVEIPLAPYRRRFSFANCLNIANLFRLLFFSLS
jgi:hypothetical protein